MSTTTQAVTRTSQPPPPAATAPRGTLATLQDLLEKHKSQIAVALPRHMTPERMIRVALTAASQTPKLAECTAISLAAAIVQSSILGLEPSSVLGEAYLVPFWNGKIKKNECQLIPGYQGLIKLARNSGEVSMFDAQVVYSNDQFEFHKGSDVYWLHKWARTGPRGHAQGVWAGYALKDGTKNFEYWTLEQIEEHRDKFSKGAFEMAWNDKTRQKEYVIGADGKRVLTGAWLDSPEWMWKKTVIRQTVKLMPKSVELATALRIEELADAGLPQQIDVLPVDVLPEDDGNQPDASGPRRKSDSSKTAADVAPAPSEELLSKIAQMEPALSTEVWQGMMATRNYKRTLDIKTEFDANDILAEMRAAVKEVKR